MLMLMLLDTYEKSDFLKKEIAFRLMCVLPLWFFVFVCIQMLSCGIPELSDQEDLKYVYDALRPHESEADATMYFTRLDKQTNLSF